MRPFTTRLLGVPLLLLPLTTQAADPKFQLQLKRAFIDEFKDRTSIDADMIVRHSHKAPNPVGTKSEDGDLHFSGESDDVGLPFVAEMVNAWQHGNAVTFIKQSAKHNETHPNAMESIAVAGAWRLWFEHPSTEQVQGGNNDFHPDHTNPDHSFEIHPVSGVGTIDLLASFAPVSNETVHPPDEYIAYPPQTAFSYFDKVEVVIKASSSGVTIRCPKLKYNYVQFVIELSQKPKKVTDGYIALAQVLDEDDEAASNQDRRMIFVQGTDAAKTVKTADSGDRFHVLGIPRINLNAVSHLVGQNGTAQFSAKLPYEMIIVGIYPN